MSHEKVVCITGASGGIGGALSRAFHGAGHRVLLVGRRASKLREIQAELGVERTECLELDLTDEAQIRTAFEGRQVDVLVNNAGIAISAPLLKGGDLYRQHMDVNFHGPRLLMEALLPGMLSSGHGYIVQIASSAALVGYAYTAAYAASKHALLGYTRSAALELGSKGIRFVTICPHFVDSPMTDQSVARIQETTGLSAEEARARLAHMNPDGELVSPQQIATVALAGLERPAAHTLLELTGREIHEVPEARP
ncbi:MAG: SDR family oxidoreductase [Planctomycetes bacterium]|nr:SDR family oxidoreductase [Planctomycetota bacterium]